jgi:YgiT-type zinc finger domain-containing protein
MECLICKNGSYEAGEVTVTLGRGESIVIIKQVPAHVCDNCGEYVLDDDVAKIVMEKAERAVANNAEVEVLQYAA